jgi:hypothetical protein
MSRPVFCHRRYAAVFPSPLTYHFLPVQLPRMPGIVLGKIPERRDFQCRGKSESRRNIRAIITSKRMGMEPGVKEKIFYIFYRRNGKQIEEKVGYQYADDSKDRGP